MIWPYEEDVYLFKIRNPRLVNNPLIQLDWWMTYYNGTWEDAHVTVEYRSFLRRFVNFRSRPFPVTNEQLYQFLQEQFYLQYQRDQHILHKLKLITPLEK